MLSTVLLLSMALSGCARFQLKDHVIYLDDSPEGSHYKHTLTPEKGDLTQEEWDALRPGMWCSDEATFLEAKEFMEFFCHETNQCDWESHQNFNRIFNEFQAMKKSVIRNSASQ